MRSYDVCVIGSGAAGGVMAKELCEGGAQVMMLEAGEELPPSRLLSHRWPYELPYRGLRGEKQAPFYPPDISPVVYQDCDHITVDRVRVLGGRTMHWNAVTLRYAPRDFRERTLAGIEEDWPLSYEEVEPYYEHIERTTTWRSYRLGNTIFLLFPGDAVSASWRALHRRWEFQ